MDDCWFNRFVGLYISQSGGWCPRAVGAPPRITIINSVVSRLQMEHLLNSTLENSIDIRQQCTATIGKTKTNRHR